MNRPSYTSRLRSAVVWISLLATLFGSTMACTTGDEDEDTCKDQDCTQPPEPLCDEEDRALSYAPTGSCQLDECAYAISVDDCAERGETCTDGICSDR